VILFSPISPLKLGIAGRDCDVSAAVKIPFDLLRVISGLLNALLILFCQMIRDTIYKGYHLNASDPF